MSEQDAGIEALLARLTDDSLPGRDVRIGRNDGEWCVAQEYCGMDESVPTGVTGNGLTLRAAVAAALAGEDAHAERRDPYPEQYRRRRERQRISLRDVARYADLRPAQVSEWERGDRTLTVQQIRLLNEALNVLVGERA